MRLVLYTTNNVICITLVSIKDNSNIQYLVCSVLHTLNKCHSNSYEEKHHPLLHTVKADQHDLKFPSHVHQNGKPFFLEIT